MVDGPPRRGETPSIHAQALANLRRGSKPVLIFLVGLFALMSVYVVGGLLLTQRNMPTVPTESEAGSGTGSGADAEDPGTAGPSDSAAAAEPRRRAVAAFLADAAKKDATRWFPGAAAETDGLTYTPRSPGDPGADRPDGLARVLYRDLPAADAQAALAAVSRGGTVDPAGLTVTSSSGTDAKWELAFTVKLRGAGATVLKGEAEGYTTPSGATVILRLVYPRPAASAG
ncbi:hypothetical protein ACGFMM_10840 [Streptomyces sp. NPDC048604]|uniref:hypothetical protein n=1 Tax=Streptomyces sp. NPDC048604 TaxID=3365578 RepID=UPI00371B2FCA